MLPSKERVSMTMNPEELDPVPMDYWAWGVVNDKLQAHLNQALRDRCKHDPAFTRV